MGDVRDSAALRWRLNEALRTAIRAHDVTSVTAFRSALGAIDNAEAVEMPNDPAAQEGKVARSRLGVGVAETARRELSTNDMLGILRAEIAERMSAALEYERMGRHERAEPLKAEARALHLFLDSALPESE